MKVYSILPPFLQKRSKNSIFNTFQLKLKSVNDFGLSVRLSVRLSVCLSVCLSVRPHDNSRKYSLISTKLTHVNMCHPSMFSIENRICSCYTFSTGPFKRNPIHYGQWVIFIQSEFY
jgi:hypothetical protein